MSGWRVDCTAKRGRSHQENPEAAAQNCGLLPRKPDKVLKFYQFEPTPHVGIDYFQERPCGLNSTSSGFYF